MELKNGFNYNIESYNTIRDVLRYVFVYGCYTREDIKEKNISTRKFENECRRIEEFISSENLDKKILYRKKYLRANYNRYKIAENYLVDSYLSKTFNKNDISLFFLIQQVLKKKGSMSLYDISDYLTLNDIDLIDNNTLFRRLESLVNSGIIIVKLESGKNIYSLSDNLFDILSDKDVKDLEGLVNFFKAYISPEVPGHYLEKSIRRFYKYENMEGKEVENVFIYNYTHFQPVLDEEIIFKLLDALENEYCVMLHYKNKKGIMKKIETIPVKLLFDRTYGRWYLAGDSGYDELTIYRVDRIYDVIKGSKISSEVDYNEIFKIQFDKSWSLAPLGNGIAPVQVNILFIADNPEGMDMLQRKVNSEKKWGEIYAVDDKSFLFSIDVTDPEEMIPWIKSFGCCAVVQKSSCHQLHEIINNHWREMKSAYGDI
jgi:predicted DNA-binding transcriptional regulator YafY